MKSVTSKAKAIKFLNSFETVKHCKFRFEGPGLLLLLPCFCAENAVDTLAWHRACEVPDSSA
jgi:hypothetical protein